MKKFHEKKKIQFIFLQCLHNDTNCLDRLDSFGYNLSALKNPHIPIDRISKSPNLVIFMTVGC